MHSARTRCSGSAGVPGRCFTSNIFIGLSARIPALSVTQRAGVRSRNFSRQVVHRGRLDRDLKIPIAKLIARVCPSPFPPFSSLPPLLPRPLREIMIPCLLRRAENT